MSDRFSFDTIVLRCKEEAKKDGGGAGGRGGCGGLGGLGSHKELDIAKGERGGECIWSPMQYSPGRRRKKKAIQARSTIALPLGEMPCAIDSM